MPDDMLTAQQAADLLNVSLEYLVDLLDRGEIPCNRVDGQPLVRAADLHTYNQKLDAESREAADALTAEAQRLGLY